MTVTTEERGQQNIWAKEPPMIIMTCKETSNQRAEKLNGRLAMLAIGGMIHHNWITGEALF